MQYKFLILSVLLLTVGIISVQSLCGDQCTKSCCEISTEDFQCCPFVNGVCCADGQSCCPQGSSCDIIGWTCSFPSGIHVSRKYLEKKNGVVDQVRPSQPTVSTPTVCPDRTSACPTNSTCCSMASGSWGCCDSPNAVCCVDGLHCCPHGTTCNAEERLCELAKHMPLTNDVDQFSPLLFLAELGQARTLSERVNHKVSENNTLHHVWSTITNSWAQCPDGVHECPGGSTCCLDQFEQYACCPFPRAVCCSDKLHCCPETYTCDTEAGLCRSGPLSQHVQQTVDQSTLKDSIPNDEQLCPDGHSRCPYSHTCCQLVDKTWGCCPLSEAVCCSDGLHCCPQGYKCNAERKTCVRDPVDAQSIQQSLPPPPPPFISRITCPGAEFQCDNGTTCCSLPNDEWACCPFPKAICCSDQAHCCPENTTCDVEHNICVSGPGNNPSPSVDTPMKIIHPKFWRFEPKVNEACQMACSDGTCCKDSAGDEACCPFMNAVCCSDGLHCCPQSMRCDGHTMMCVPAKSSGALPEITPWLEKMPARQGPITANTPSVLKVSSFAPNVTCPDRKHICKNNQTCCPLEHKGYGCCPFPNATCCSDRQHCCPANTTCGWFGSCVRRLSVKSVPTVSEAYKMLPTTGKSSLPPTVSNLEYHVGMPVHAEWCGNLCPDVGFCCADASGQPRRKCCPTTAGVCCSDGEYCCPRGTRCIGNGKCLSESQNVQTSSAPYLIPAMDTNGTSAGFLQGLRSHSSYLRALASKTTPAKVNPMFLLDFYYRSNARKFTVCADLERTCGVDQQCCPSLKEKYTCAPKGTTCCPHTSDTYCPSGAVCSQDGLLCGPA